jgi:hypothetical protein
MDVEERQRRREKTEAEAQEHLRSLANKPALTSEPLTISSALATKLERMKAAL